MTTLEFLQILISNIAINTSTAKRTSASQNLQTYRSSTSHKMEQEHDSGRGAFRAPFGRIDLRPHLRIPTAPFPQLSHQRFVLTRRDHPHRACPHSAKSESPKRGGAGLSRRQRKGCQGSWKASLLLLKEGQGVECRGKVDGKHRYGQERGCIRCTDSFGGCW